MRLSAPTCLALLPLWACSPSSDLSGSYIGSAVCGEEDDEYNIELALNATEADFVYSGGLCSSTRRFSLSVVTRLILQPIFSMTFPPPSPFEPVPKTSILM